MTEQTAHEALGVAVQAAHAAGLVIPCRTRDGALWTSESATDRARAARRCTDDACPVLDACHAAAEDTGERWHIWAGVDREEQYKTGRRKRTA